MVEQAPKMYEAGVVVVAFWAGVFVSAFGFSIGLNWTLLSKRRHEPK